MANRKISELQSRTPALSDLMLVGDPSSGYSYKCTVTALATIIETDIADGFVTIGTTQTVSGAKTFSNNLTLTSVANTPTDPDKFLTLNASNVVTYRTGSQVLSDIGGQGTITLTTTGTSGAATLVGNTLNIPQYQSALTNPVTGTGTTNYVTKWTSSSAVGNSQIIDNGTAIGIGTAPSNAYILSVAGIYRGVGVGNASRIELYDTQSGGATFFISPQESLGVTSLGTYGAFPVLFVTNSTERIRIASAGDVTISTIANATVDTDKFLVSDSGVIKYRTGSEVLSDIGGASSSSISGTTNYIPKFTSSSAIGNSVIYDASGNIGIGITTPLQTAANRNVLTVNGTNSSIVNLGVGGSLGSYMYADASGGTYETVGTNAISASGANVITLSTNSSERLRITSTGNVSIGGTTASSIFNINGVDPLISFQNGGTTKWQVGLENTSSDRFIWYNNAGAAYRMILDASGNLGLGVSPSAWGSNYRAIQGGNGSNGVGGSLAFFNNLANGVLLYSNATNDNTNDIYTFTAPAAKYVLENNVYKWFQAPQGTAGNAISFTQAMTLDASGRLGIGTTSPTRKVETVGGNEGGFNVIGNNGATNLTNNGLGFNTGYGVSYIVSKNTAGANADLYFEASKFLFGGGNVGIGTSSPEALLDLYNSSGVQLRLANSTTGLAATDGSRIYLSGSDLFIVNRETANIQLYTSDTERMRITSGGELLINTTSDAGDYKLQVNGNVYATGNTIVSSASDNGYLVTNGTDYSYFSQARATNSYITGAAASDAVVRGKNGVIIGGNNGDGSGLRIASTGEATFSSSIKTAAPSGGTAKPWKLGSVVAGSVTYSSTYYVQVEIDGVFYKLALAADA